MSVYWGDLEILYNSVKFFVLESQILIVKEIRLWMKEEAKSHWKIFTVVLSKHIIDLIKIVHNNIGGMVAEEGRTKRFKICVVTNKKYINI